MGMRTDVTDDIADLEGPSPRRGRRNWFWRVVSESFQAKVGLGVLLFFIGIALLAPWIMPYDVHTSVGPRFEPPSWEHPLGLDDGGVDMLSLLIQGGRVSLIVGFAATLVAIVVGGGIGMIAGYFGGWSDSVLMRITDYFLVIPDLPLAIVVAAVWGASLTHLIFVIALLLWTTTARIVRAQVKSVRERVYVRRARSLGSSDLRIVFRHVLPRSAHSWSRTSSSRSRSRSSTRPRSRSSDSATPRRSRGEHHRVRVPAHRHLRRRVVGRHPRRPVCRVRDHGVLLAGSGDRGRPEPSAEGVLPVAPDLPRPTSLRHGGADTVSLLEVRDLTSGSTCPRASSCTRSG
jgi:ABC-type dipeptide/oligopeptide/nickel transport system permease subunit